MVFKVGQCCTLNPSKCHCTSLSGKCNCPSQTICPRVLSDFEKNVKHYTEVYLKAVKNLRRNSWLFRNKKISLAKFKVNKAAYEQIRDNAANQLAVLKGSKQAEARA